MISEADVGRSTIGVAPCGAGKSLIAAALAMSHARSLILVHKQKLLVQNASKLGGNVTMACAGLGPVDFTGQHVVASRDTARSRLESLRPVDAVIIDEAHLVGDEPKLGLSTDLRAFEGS